MRYRRQERLRLGRAQEPIEELDEEIRAHIEMRAEDLMAEGLPSEEARAEALRRFGDLEAARKALLLDAVRRQRRLRWMSRIEGLSRDVAVAFRSLHRARGFTALSLLILATAIGLASATFAVTDHVLLRPLPYPEPSSLVTLQSVGEGGPFDQVSMANWVDWKERSTALSATALWRVSRMTIGGAGTDPFRVEGVVAHGDLWGTLGARFAAGRPFAEAEAQAGERLAVVSEDLWRNELGETADLDRLTLEIDGVRHAVVGVVARGQAFPDGADVWISAPYTPGSGGTRNNISYEAVARIRPDVTIERAASELSAIALGIQQSDPEAIYSYGVGVAPLHERVTGGARRSIVVLMSAVLLVLLVACANLAGLGLARARRMEGDFAVRLALGAGRARLVRQVLVEHAVLASAGAALGLWLAWMGIGRLLAALPDRLPRADAVVVDARVLLFAAAVAAAAALATGAGPAAAVLRGRMGPGAQGARGRIRGGRGLPGAFMVGAEVALATAFLIGGGLLVRSFVAAASRPLGFEPEGVVTLEVTLTGSTYDDTGATVAYWNRVLERLGAEPAVEAAAVGNWIPTGGSGTSFVELEGGAEADLGAGYRVVSDRYFDAMGTAVLAGRTFNASDDLGTERVGLVNEALAARYWPGDSPLGKRLKATSMEAYYHGGVAPWITVVGVAGDVRHHGFETDPRPELFVLYRQVPDWTRAMTAVIRTRPGAGDTVGGLSEVARSVDPSLAVDAATLASRVRALLAERRLVLGALWTFAALAVLLACLGVYALISFAAQERTREIAIRSALGADRGGILTLMLRDAGRVVFWGLGAGILAGFALTHVLRSLLVDVTATDPLTYAGAAAVLALVGVGAALVPSWRAARADPLGVLGA
jgi:predicted permease